jgi:filamentous hemagglutinin
MASRTRAGILRTNAADWRVTRDLWDSLGYGDVLSQTNRAAIAKGLTPTVDDAWLSYFPEHAPYLGELITMHHVQGLPLTIPAPASLHLDSHMPGGFRYNSGGIPPAY